MQNLSLLLNETFINQTNVEIITLSLYFFNSLSKFLRIMPLCILSIQEHEFMIALQGLITPPQLVLVITQCPFSVPGKEMQWLLRPEK